MLFRSGGFAPYAQGQEGEAYVIDGIEFRVVSALADDFTVRAYVEARELEGDRLSKLERNVLGGAFGLVDVPIKDMGTAKARGAAPPAASAWIMTRRPKPPCWLSPAGGR